MAENKEGKEITAPQVVKIGDKEVPVEELVKYYENKPKFETDYHHRGEELNTLKRQNQELANEMAALKGKKVEDGDKRGKRLLPSVESDDFLDALVTTVESLHGKLAEVDKGYQGLRKEREDEIHESVNKRNFRTLKKFVAENKEVLGIDHVSDDPKEWSKELQELTQTAGFSRHNTFPRGSKIPEISEEALRDALILQHRDSIVSKSQERGEQSIIEQIIGKKRQAEGKKPVVEKEPTMEYLAQHWNDLSDAERDKYYEKVFGRKRV